ncbi:hypothetical protein ACHAWF_012620, partial [Thalassiosira exigua]
MSSRHVALNERRQWKEYCRGRHWYIASSGTTIWSMARHIPQQAANQNIPLTQNTPDVHAALSDLIKLCSNFFVK